MVRFRNAGDVDAVSAHNEIVQAKGKVAWGLWLKDFENKQAIIDRLGGLGAPLTQMYIADTSQKANWPAPGSADTE